MEDDGHIVIIIRSLTPRSRTDGAHALGQGQTRWQKVHSWGENRNGENGRGEVRDDGRGRTTDTRANGRLTERRRTQVAFKGSCASGEIVELGWDLGDYIKGVASGLNHAVAYTEGGAAYAWGRNRCGELGTGTFDSVTTPVRILNDVNVVDVAVGAEHTLALASDGRLYAFGCNARGALGIGSGDLGRFSTPQAVTSPETFVAIAAAGAHSVGLTAGGGVYTWGANNQGQLGHGGCIFPGGPGNDPCLNDLHTPTKVRITSTGEVLPPVKLITAGGGEVAGDEHGTKGGHTVVVTTSDVVFAWGDNSAGQLGIRQVYANASDATYGNNTLSYTHNKYDSTTGLYYNRHELPTAIEPHAIVVAAGTEIEISKRGLPAIKQIAAGNAHTVMLLVTGELFTWGDNYYGQLGLGYASRDNTPQKFYISRNYREPQMIDAPKRITKFDYASNETDPITSQLINITVTGRIKEENDTMFTKISAGGDVSLALTANEKIFVWGNNADGQLGTCGCGSCALYGAADVQKACTKETVNSSCPCSCGGLGTCVYEAASASNNFKAKNEGKCVDFDGTPACDCSSNAVERTYLNDQGKEEIRYGVQGTIELMDEPILSSLLFEKSFTKVKYASAGGGSIYAVTESVCKDDVNGVVCSGRGKCLPDGSCQCDEGAGGVTCENVCPKATQDDADALRNNGLEEDVTNAVCSNHGTCNAVTAACECDEQFFGPKCSYICARNSNGDVCSGNGTCVFDAAVSQYPYCECDRFQDQGACQARGLQMYPEGWCSFHGGEEFGGFASCYATGACGNCDSPAGAVSVVLSLLIVFVVTALATSP